MTGLALLATIIVAAVTGSAFALLTDAMRAESRWLDDLTRMRQAHRVGRHARPGGRGDCLLCGLRDDPFDVAQDGL